MSAGRIQPRKGAGRLRVIDGQAGVSGALVREAMTTPEALEQICDHYVPKIYNFILKRVGNVQDAEDVTSIVFEKVVVNMGTFDETKASFTTWIYRIATNSVTDFYRSKGRRKESSLDDEAASEPAGAGDDLDRADLYIVMLDLLKQLPQKYQEAVTLRYFGGLRVQEVAEALGITESAASKRILRGLDELKELARGGPLSGLT
ncbi:MAG: RNA polymerase sigma factor [Candidatus Geothermincolia bacterium]